MRLREQERATPRAQLGQETPETDRGLRALSRFFCAIARQRHSAGWARPHLLER